MCCFLEVQPDCIVDLGVWQVKMLNSFGIEDVFECVRWNADVDQMQLREVERCLVLSLICLALFEELLIQEASKNVSEPVADVRRLLERFLAMVR